MDNFGVPLGRVLAVAYQIVAGVRYRLILQNSLGIAQVTCVTVYWLEQVEIESLAFITGTPEL